MSVLLADRRLGVRRRATGAVDAHGDRPGAGWGEVEGPLPGRASEGPDTTIGADGGRTWVLAVDPALWPIVQQDLVADPDTGQEWLVTSADLVTHNADPAVNYVRVEAHIRTTADTGAGTRA